MKKRMILGTAFLIAVCLEPLSGRAAAQTRPPRPAPTPGAMLQQGFLDFDTPAFRLRLVRSSQTAAALEPKSASAFDFTPADRLIERSRDGYYHLGDVDLRVRERGTTEWRGFSSARARIPVAALPVTGGQLAAADLTPTLGPGCPLTVIRRWLVVDGALVLRFTLENRTLSPVELGSLGLALVFNNILTRRPLDEAHAACSFSDPYIGGDAGYVQVTRLSGRGPALVVVPDGKTPLEAYNPILNPQRGAEPSAPPLFTDLTPRDQPFEGFFDWMVHSRAFAENEWSKAKPWNPPTSVEILPGASVSYGLRFLASPAIRSIETTLAEAGRPVAVGIPGYILPTDVEARLFLRYGRPVKSVSVEPAGALSFREDKPTPNGWKAYTLRGRTWGRARLAVTYADGSTQAVNYFVIKPQTEAVADLGRFLTTRQWFVDPADPFKRSPSVMTYDREENRIVTQDQRAWIAGLGDEGGSSWLTGIMKQLGRPDPGEIAKYQLFVDGVVWGGLQYTEGPLQFGVRKSLFYYQPDQMPAGYYRSDLSWGSWTSWKKKDTEIANRSYDYPHVAALHWVFYRLARNTVGLVTNHPWDWYLRNAQRTALAMVQYAGHYAQYGQMEGTIFLDILLDLQREGWTAEAAALEAAMRKRADLWRSLAYPFGSEMPWDSTGQEEVYAWTRYFGDAAKAAVCLDAILGYMPTVPHWGYNGNARRYWDFLYGAKLSRIERQIHHYGSGLNAIPLLSAFREHPEDIYLLRVGYGGAMGALASIDREGFASAAFHSFPDTLRFDAYSGDYAQNFFGHALNTAAYVVEHPEFGKLAFGGSLEVSGRTTVLTPSDSFRTRVYWAPLGLWLTLDAGRFEKLEWDPRSGVLGIRLAAADAFTPAARLRIEQPALVPGAGRFRLRGDFKTERGAWVIPLKTTARRIELAAAEK
jgi:hypothetical protein